jgi:hypothetical protein
VQAATYKIHWYDPEQTILLLEAGDDWTWTDAHRALEEVNETVKRAEREVYVVIHFLSGQIQLPKGKGALTNVRYLLSADPSAEQLTIYVGRSGFLQALLGMATNVFGLSAALEKLRFVSTLDEALAEIAAHQHK